MATEDDSDDFGSEGKFVHKRFHVIVLIASICCLMIAYFPLLLETRVTKAWRDGFQSENVIRTRTVTVSPTL